MPQACQRINAMTQQGPQVLATTIDVGGSSLGFEFETTQEQRGILVPNLLSHDLPAVPPCLLVAPCIHLEPAI